MVESHFVYELFGGKAEVVIYDAERELLEDIMNDFYREALRLQKIFNFYDKESELSLLNKKRKMNVSNELLEVIAKAIHFAKKTKGQYDISLGKSIIQRKKGEQVNNTKCSYKDIIIERDEVSLTNDDVLIDLGSIAKGYIADKLAEFLKEQGIINFLIDARGDIIVSGEYEHIIDIQHPRNEKKKLLSVKIKNKGIATSGDYKQYYGEYDNSHIINANSIISASVVADTLTDADAYASAIFVSDDKERTKIMKENSGVKCMTVDKNLIKKEYNNFKELIANEL